MHVTLDEVNDAIFRIEAKAENGYICRPCEKDALSHFKKGRLTPVSYRKVYAIAKPFDIQRFKSNVCRVKALLEPDGGIWVDSKRGRKKTFDPKRIWLALCGENFDLQPSHIVEAQRLIQDGANTQSTTTTRTG